MLSFQPIESGHHEIPLEEWRTHLSFEELDAPSGVIDDESHQELSNREFINIMAEALGSRVVIGQANCPDAKQNNHQVSRDRASREERYKRHMAAVILQRPQ